jgi:hypothetical protein
LDGFWSGDFDFFFRYVRQQNLVSSIDGEELQASALLGVML